MSAGCLAFLRECAGEARIVAGIPQLLEDLGLAGPASGRPPPGPTGTAGLRRGEARVRDRARPKGPAAAAVVGAMGGAERSIAAALIEGLGTADELVAALDLPVAAVLGALTLLEMRGLVVAAYGRYRPAGPLAGATRGSTLGSTIGSTLGARDGSGVSTAGNGDLRRIGGSIPDASPPPVTAAGEERPGTT
jgi:hypothetical protein